MKWGNFVARGKKNPKNLNRHMIISRNKLEMRMFYFSGTTASVGKASVAKLSLVYLDFFFCYQYNHKDTACNPVYINLFCRPIFTSQCL